MKSNNKTTNIIHSLKTYTDMNQEFIKINDPEQCETITVKFADYPILYQAKREELIEQGMTAESADKFLKDAEVEIELYYHKHSGLFAVESGAVEACPNGELVSPYDGKTELREVDEDADDDDLDF